MPRTKSDQIADTHPPVLHTPRGASPRGLRSDAFVVRPEIAPPSVVPGPEETKERIPAEASATAPPPGGARDWEFAMPAQVREPVRDPLIDPDINGRNHTALRAPAEAPIPQLARERFTENWQRLAAEPGRGNGNRVRRGLEKSGLTRWMFSNGQFETGAALGLLFLIALLVAAFIYGWRIITGHQ